MKKGLKKTLCVLSLAMMFTSCGTGGNTPTSSSSEADPSISEPTSISEVVQKTYDKNDKKLFIEELEEGDIADDVTNDIYTLVGNHEGEGKKTMTVASCETEFDGYTYEKLLKTQSASQTSETKLSRVITFTATGKGKVTIIAKSGSTDARAIGVYSKEKSCEHDSKTVGEEVTKIELEFHYAGTYYITSAANVSIYSISTTWEDGVNEDWKPTIKLTDNNKLLVSEIPAATYNEKEEVGNFILNPGKTVKEEKEEIGKITVEGNKKTYDGVEYTSRLKLNALGSRDYSSIIIKTTSAAKINIIAISSNSSTDSVVSFIKLGETAEADTFIGDGTLIGSAVSALSFTVDAAGDYAFFAKSGKPCNIYCIEIQPIEL